MDKTVPGPGQSLADRLTNSLHFAGIDAQEMAEHLGINRSTVDAWIAGRSQPRLLTLLQWSELTGAPYEWLAGIEDPDH